MEQAPRPKHITPPEIEELSKKGVSFVVNSHGQAIETDSDPDPKVRGDNRYERSYRSSMEEYRRWEEEYNKNRKKS